MYWWSKHSNWSAFEFLFITLYALVLFFLSALLFPHDMDRDIDLEEYFFKQRRWFFSSLIVAWLLDIPETLLKGEAGLRDVPTAYGFFIAGHMGIATVGLITESRAVHFALPIVWLIGILAYVGTSTLASIAN